jgi:hypothetical protein
MANPIPPSARPFLRRIAIAYAVAYAVIVGAFAAFKAGVGADALPWAEVFYGPAITVVSCFLILVAGVWYECRKG